METRKITLEEALDVLREIHQTRHYFGATARKKGTDKLREFMAKPVEDSLTQLEHDNFLVKDRQEDGTFQYRTINLTGLREIRYNGVKYVLDTPNPSIVNI